MKNEYVAPVKGAAKYTAAKDSNNRACIFMLDTEGYTSHIETCKDLPTAIKKAQKWQVNENKAVLKSQKK